MITRILWGEKKNPKWDFYQELYRMGFLFLSFRHLRLFSFFSQITLLAAIIKGPKVEQSKPVPGWVGWVTAPLLFPFFALSKTVNFEV